MPHHRPGPAKGSDISRVPICFFDHPSIRGAAIVECDSEGSGVLKDDRADG